MISSGDIPTLDRRALLRGAILLVGGSLAGVSEMALAADAPAARFFNPIEFQALSQVVDIIIPPTDTPGAREAGVPEALDSLMVHWASSERQAQFRSLIHEYAAGGVLALPLGERLELVRQLDSEKLKSWDPTYVKFKELVLTLYYLSEVGATRELRYELSPGKFEPWTEMAPDARAWAV